MKFDILKVGGKSRSSRVRARHLQSVAYMRSCHLRISASDRVSKTARGKCSPAILQMTQLQNPTPGSCQNDTVNSRPATLCQLSQNLLNHTTTRESFSHSVGSVPSELFCLAVLSPSKSEMQKGLLFLSVFSAL
ncbi:hypothetical protein AVEN_81360-1 [Araneus ventricosus]|uniref:Uncharacterized protein n=1 Tax=Araneus ventricosus TaxID=182803 RepID=A0A4Y2B900_ARAVE|nr:hypothetical protein AVEN_81360-1 [Araneus ventricosus]